MLVWIIVIVAIIALIGGWWIWNTVRWTKSNNTLRRVSPRMFHAEDVDKENRSTHHRAAGGEGDR